VYTVKYEVFGGVRLMGNAIAPIAIEARAVMASFLMFDDIE